MGSRSGPFARQWKNARNNHDGAQRRQATDGTAHFCRGSPLAGGGEVLGKTVEKIVSGGQTGADRAALDVAFELGFATGGWIPRGRLAEDGVVPQRYKGLVEADSDRYERRTELNIRDSDATVVFAFGPPTGGTALTVRLARSQGKPLLALDLEQCTRDEATARMQKWLAEVGPRVLNVAGPRLSQEPRIAEATATILRAALR